MALADPVRRAVVARLSRGPATVNELAELFPITKQATSKHIAVLERAGLVTRTREAQRRPVHLAPARLEQLTAWIDRYRLVAEARYRSLDDVLASMAEEDRDGPAQHPPHDDTQHDDTQHDDTQHDDSDHNHTEQEDQT
nr:metalloregulator ArsR/SmtB family transcription factor [Auraticoccus cholistanensis]